jgi:hypothetical protein
MRIEEHEWSICVEQLEAGRAAREGQKHQEEQA